MAKVEFSIEHDSFAFGPFPVDELNKLDGLSVISIMISTIKEEVTLIFDEEEDVHAAIFVVGQYAYQLMHKNRVHKQN